VSDQQATDLRIMSAVNGTRLVSIGAARPTVTHTAADLGAPFGKDAEWVEARTGIECLRRLAPDETIEDLAVTAGERALMTAGVGVVDLVITASCSRLPEHGQSVAARLAPGAATFEINSACSGFSYALAAADAFIRTGSAHTVLVIAAEQMSRLIDPTDLGTSIIFGDGAGAAVVTASDDGAQIGPVVFGSDGVNAELIECDPSGILRMQGRSVFRWAVDTVPALVEQACQRAGVTPADIEVFVPHQANRRITDAVIRKLDLDHAIVASDVATSGNTSAASIPLAIETLLATEPRAHGALAVLVGFGAGLTYAAQVARLPAAT
jgi:3-oxoacyl-[acyl-carrier-protein] synthase III